MSTSLNKTTVVHDKVRGRRGRGKVISYYFCFLGGDSSPVGFGPLPGGLRTNSALRL